MKEEKEQAVMKRHSLQQFSKEEFFQRKTKEKEQIAAEKERKIKEMEEKEAEILEKIKTTQTLQLIEFKQLEEVMCE